MVATLQKTWRKNAMGIPSSITAYSDANQWLLWAIKELMRLGNNGVKDGPNAWTVVGSSDATSFAMDGTDYWVDYEDLNWSTTGNRSWIVLRNAAMGGGSGFELCFSCEGSSTYNYNLTLVYSYSAGFTGGALNARPTATDEFVVFYQNSADWMGASSYKEFNINRLFSTDGEVTRLIVTEGGTCLGVLFFEKLANPASWVDQNAVVYVHYTTPEDDDLVTSDAWWGKINGTESRFRTATLNFYDGPVWDNGSFQQPNWEGKWAMVKANAYCVSPPNTGKAGEFFDLYTCPNVLTNGYTLPGAGGEKEFVCFGGIAYGNDGTSMRM